MSMSRNDDSKSDSKCLEDFKIETRFEGENTIEIPRRGNGSGEIVWKWEAKLGYGLQTNVWLEKSPIAGSLRVVKAIEKIVDDAGTADVPLQDAAHQVDYRRELKALALLCEHEVCFVKFFGFFENPTAPPWCRNNIFLAMEYFPLGDLYRVLCAPDSQPSTEEDARYIASQLLYCLQIMHGLGITHRDLKPQNVFVVQRYPFWWLKLGDFGVSKAVADGLRTRVGTMAYMAPELIDAKIEKYTSAVDMWSLGCVIYWVLTQAIPFPSFGVTSTSDFIKDEKKFPIEALEEKNVSEDGIQFLQKLIIANPSSRLSAGEALEHTWLRRLQKWGCELEQKARQRDIPEIRKEDIVIAVIGETGVGKSSFINDFVPGIVLVGGGLQSVTQTIDFYECKYKGQRIILVDTPGFDDTARSNSDVLRDLAMWLRAAYNREVFLTGLIYMHPISQIRFTGSTSRIWRLVRQLCGDSMSGFVLCTTMWNRVELDMAVERESSLLDLLDLTMFKRSMSPAFRYGGQREEAELVIDYLVSHGRPEVLAIQKEMFQMRLSLKQTEAGRVLWQDLDRQQARYRKDMEVLRTEMETARRGKDYELAESLDRERSSHYHRHQMLELSMVQLQVDNETLSKEFDERRANEWKKLLEVLRRTEARLIQEQADKLGQAQASGQGASKPIGGLPGQTKEYVQDLKSIRSSFTRNSCKPM